MSIIIYLINRAIVQIKIKYDLDVKNRTSFNGIHLQIIFKDTSEVILQLRSSKIGQNLLPIGRILQEKYKEKSLSNIMISKGKSKGG